MADGAVEEDDVTDALVWTSEVDGSYVYLQTGGQYLARVSGSDYLVLPASKPATNIGGWHYSSSHELYVVSSTQYFLYYDATNGYFRTNSETVVQVSSWSISRSNRPGPIR